VSQEAADSMPKAYASDKSLPRVAIIGGGIGGLALGVACWHRNIPFTVYERDTSFLQRKQGYGLTLQQASKALKGFGIQSVAGGITSTRHVVHTQDGQQVAEWGLRKWGRSSPSKPRRQNVHIARQALRYELLQALQEQVQWGFQLKGLKETDNNVELTFAHADGKEIAETADVVVGADGIRSTVRSFLVEETQTPLQYLGCLVILGICPLGALERYQESELFDGHTVFQTADGTTRLYAMPFSKSEYMWQLSFPEEEDKAKMASQTGTLKEAALQKCETWHDPIPQLLRATPADFISGYPVYDRSLLEPRILASKSKRVTLLGDAAQ
jgi:2-polyprenyl-6-methoxyphenol hydroxylase-like FAD-dependent oxidoreductase